MMARRYTEYVQKRPAADSVPLIECEHTWCGGQVTQGSLEDVEVGVLVGDTARKFCSPGCASRWLIRFELRGPTAPAPASPASRPRQGSAHPAAPAQIRAWARAQGMPVGDRARLARAVVDAYERAHR